jgi:hypothetical protein
MRHESLLALIPSFRISDLLTTLERVRLKALSDQRDISSRKKYWLRDSIELAHGRGQEQKATRLAQVLEDYLHGKS